MKIYELSTCSNCGRVVPVTVEFRYRLELCMDCMDDAIKAVKLASFIASRGPNVEEPNKYDSVNEQALIDPLPDAPEEADNGRSIV